MEKKLVLAALSIVALTGTMAYAGAGAGSGVAGSIHDMTIYQTPIGQDDPEKTDGRVCAYCHTPHHAIIAGHDYLPLWSHTISTKQFTPYDSATIDASIDQATMMVGPSKLCMSCHDGTVAVDTHYAYTNGTKKLEDDSFTKPSVGYSGLNNDHPIGFVYNDVATGPTSGDPGLASHVDGKDEWIRISDAKYAGSNLKIADRLFSRATDGKGIMTCATCHDVHNKKNKDDGDSKNYLLLATNKGSALCLSCHIK